MLNQLRPFASQTAKPITKKLAQKNITPDQLSITSLIAAILSAIAYIFGNLIIAGTLVLINSILDLLDGELARTLGKTGRQGDFTDHIIDRYADIFILAGITLSPYAPTYLGILAITAVLMTSYLGTQSQAVGIGRVYAGLLGRANRLLLIISTTYLTAIYPHKIMGYTLIGWLLILFIILGTITIIQRTNQIKTRLR
ncbi:CDP-alcohol phosphatidyltransferase family protein [Methanonatronarchaeum sp. AMET-Sl]|uniref:CDP-alcohol phosphatidyltransferase family protein n=1 Tax=Methanonatronarchaeum sp. AMET-Sl TaxID=3037654 RepID=UPI00244DD204|nr:CDP-alcohol phosphatidyltransferase family protein [Methanonatronarchaeum sp. AMET-Sl]WGI18031.1 CDP-alcohol phosphatidyltransferase family protein [Methanonatronarchaeum sp. AMET-Sl]